jgi:hypothetical protein
MPSGTLTVLDVFTRVRELLGDRDPGGLQWLDAELITWLNEGALEIVRYRPEASSTTAQLSLVAGTQQALPTDGISMLTAEHNGDTATPGRVCKLISRRQLDHVQPDWHTHSRKAEVVWIMPSEANPRIFWVYPPNDGAGVITMTYASYPSLVALQTDKIPVPDTFLAPLVDYMCYRAYQKQLESQESQSRANEHRELFANAIGITNAVMAERGASSRMAKGVV